MPNALTRNGEQEPDHRSLPNSAADFDATIMIFDYAFDNPKAQAGPLFSLGGDKGLEHGFLQIGGDASSGIGHDHASPGMHGSGSANLLGTNTHFAARGHA